MTPCSDITLAQVAGLNQNLAERLLGKNRYLWLKAYKRFLRMENPWIPMERVLEVPANHHTGQSIERQRQRLERLHIGTGNLQFLEASAGKGSAFLLETPIKSDLPLPVHHVVMVELKDLLSTEERCTFTYEQMLEKAREEFGLDWCSLLFGLEACAIILESLRAVTPHNSSAGIVVCTQTFNVTNDGPKVPSLICGGGPTTSASTQWGFATLQTAESVVRDSHGDLKLLFRSIPW
jgi:hypothetical protein